MIVVRGWGVFRSGITSRESPEFDTDPVLRTFMHDGRESFAVFATKEDAYKWLEVNDGRGIRAEVHYVRKIEIL